MIAPPLLHGGPSPACPFIASAAVERLTPWSLLLPALEAAFQQPPSMPGRHGTDIPVPGDRPGSLLVMPAWRAGDVLGVKLVTVFPGARALGKAAVSGLYMLANGRTGEPLALFDAQELTARRTAGTSALAASYLARRNSTALLMIGAGHLAPRLIAAHAAVRPITTVMIWARDPSKAAALAADVRTTSGLAVHAVTDLAPAASAADIISVATLSSTPLLEGQWLSPGVHIDLVGGFTAKMREADDVVMRRATIWLDQHDACLREAGDIVDPLARGVIGLEAICGDLFGLVAGSACGRSSADAITLFKSVGLALEDLAAAELAWGGWQREQSRMPKTASLTA